MVLCSEQFILILRNWKALLGQLSDCVASTRFHKVRSFR